jgi:hypothetical protein
MNGTKRAIDSERKWHCQSTVLAGTADPMTRMMFVIYCLTVVQLIFATVESTTTYGAGLAFGVGEEIDFTANVPEEFREELESSIGSGVRIGHYSKRFYLALPLEIWAWDGRFVLYHNEHLKEYVKPDREQWHAVLGTAPEKLYSTPTRYRFPPGIVVIGCVVVGGLIWSRAKCWFGVPDGQVAVSVEMLLQDARFAEAMNIYVNACGERGNPLLIFPDALRDAVQFLVETHDVDPSVAEAYMLGILEYCARGEADDLRSQAGDDEHSKDYEAARSAYAQAADLLERWDPKDSEFLRKCERRAEMKIR